MYKFNRCKLVFGLLLVGCVTVGSFALAKSASTVVPKTEVPITAVLPADVPGLQNWINSRFKTNNCNVLVPAELPAEADVTGWWIQRKFKASTLDREALYQLAAGHLALGKNMLSAENEGKRQQGLGVLLQTAMACKKVLKDELLAVAIFDGWILPNIDMATAPNTEWLGKKNILFYADYLYWAVKDTERTERLQKLIMVQLTHPNDVDCARFRLARMAVDRGDLPLAVEYLKGIDATNSNGMFGARSQIAPLEKRIRRNNEKKRVEK